VKANIFEAIEQLMRGKRMSRDMVKEIVSAALVSAARKSSGISPERVIVSVDDSSGAITVVLRKMVVEGRPTSPDEIGLAEAKKARTGAAVGEDVDLKVPIDDLGRIAAQTAKHIVLQRVRETERTSLFEEFASKTGKAVTSVVKQRRGKLVILDLGDAEAVLPGNEQIPKEDYRPGEHFKVYVVEVSSTPRGPHILASRNRPELVKLLFEHEVPEIAQGIVEVKAIAREAGSRTKVAVYSTDRNIDPVGACIGMKGMRVQAVVQELHGEKMDVVMWDENPEAFLIASLSPAKPARVIRDDDAKKMIAVASDKNQLQHLIGRGGQNARLANKLTGWRVDILTEAELRGEAEDGTPLVAAVPAAGEIPAADAPVEGVPAETAAAPAEVPAPAVEPSQAPETPAEAEAPADGGQNVNS